MSQARPLWRASLSASHLQPANPAQKGTATMNWTDKVSAIYRDHAKELRFAAFKFRAMGFRITRVTLDRLAYRLAFNGVNWKQAATREALYQLSLALDPEYMPNCAKHMPFMIGL
jgi:hypothetical protein